MIYVIERSVDGMPDFVEVDVDKVELQDGRAIMFTRIHADPAAPLTCVGDIDATGFYPKLQQCELKGGSKQ